MKICFVGYFVPGRISGPSDSVINLSKNLNGIADSVVVVSTNKDVKAAFDISGVTVFPLWDVYTRINACDVVVLCGIYDSQILRLCRFAERVGKPYVISARGNLTKASQKKSFLKKLIFRKLFVNRVLKKAAAVHFLTHDERSMSLNPGTKSFVVPNGVSVPKEPCGEKEADYDRTIVFLGRLDVYHKGIDIILQSILMLKEDLKLTKWKFKFFGPDYSARDRKWIEKFVKINDISDIVSFPGPAYEEDKFRAIGEGRFFIHASRYEGQPQGVIQAMAVGSIPLISKGCNLESLNQKYRFGVGIGDTPQLVASRIKALFALKPEELDRLSLLNRKIVSDCFDWAKVAQDFYDNLKKLV